MGLFNAISSINNINRLLKDLENQVTITLGQIQSNESVNTLNNSLNVHKRIHQELIDAFCNSSAARGTVFTIFGNKMQMHDILKYSKDFIYNLYALIQNKQSI